MVFVIGTFRVEPSERAAFISNRVPLMQHSRAEAGCVIYTFTEDPIEHDVVVLTEQWIDRPSLDAHLAGLATAPQPATMPGSTGRDIAVFEADDGAKL